MAAFRLSVFLDERPFQRAWSVGFVSLANTSIFKI